ncbi:hypothetical protein IJ21_23340 [Paenibacillus sp. 32O-W]|uniref:hypothetical protein n=1 Tax=Paenibacillus sp. 32O-W TaxID=1695218 RepID=UPI00071F31BA|nr:hypothetical protein [Paenibacillus sp. 32O-W]ALS27731.1 hypothetical protein IJ21_23340 [Paenibacillus sp. 32O-W]
MDKRQKRSELVYALGFLLMLIALVGAFLYGVKVGADKTEERLKPAPANAAVRSVPASDNGS